MGMFISSQNSCDFATVTITGESEDEGTTEGIIRNYYDHEDGKITPRFEGWDRTLTSISTIQVCMSASAALLEWYFWYLRDYWIGISSARDFLGTAPSYTLIRDPILRGRNVDLVNVPYLLARDMGGLTIIAPELPVIDTTEFVRLRISVELDDTWAWVAMGPERQPNAAVGIPAEAKDALIVDEGGKADSAPMQAPQQPPPPPVAPTRTIPQRIYV
nr:hypothetical protein [Tanacetum cinerariifolium]